MTKNHDGSISFPVRGNPPEPPNGYERDLNDLYLFHPIVEQCKYRQINEFIKPCGKIGINWNCLLLDRSVSTMICLSCDKVEI